MLWSLLQFCCANFVSENVFAKWENFRDFEDAFPGFCTFQFAVCGWNCVGRYYVVRVPYRVVARELSDFVT